MPSNLIPQIGDRVEFTAAAPHLTGTGSSPYVTRQTMRVRGEVVGMDPLTDEDPYYTVQCDDGKERIVRALTFTPEYVGVQAVILQAGAYHNES